VTKPLSRRSFLAAGAAAITGLLSRRSEAMAAQPNLPNGEFMTDQAEPKTIQIICRAAWGARKSRGKFVHHTVKRLTVHHSAMVLRDNRKAPQRFRDHQILHLKKGWPDIAYHILIDRHGNVYRGRPSWARGDTATHYDPTGHLLVLCEGNFERQQIPDAQVDALVDVLAWAAERFGVSTRTIHGHRDYAATACPGTDLYAMIKSGVIRKRVKRRIALGGVELSGLCGSAGLRRVRDIENGRD
jgi:N-acetylmuramoyl-L-alanine amidase-like protein